MLQPTLVKWDHEPTKQLTCEQEYEQREERDLCLIAVVYKETETGSKQSPRKVWEREQQEISPAEGVDRLQNSPIKISRKGRWSMRTQIAGNANNQFTIPKPKLASKA